MAPLSCGTFCSLFILGIMIPTSWSHVCLSVRLSAQKRRKPLRHIFCWQWPRVNPRRVDTKPYRVWASRPPVLRDMNFTLGGFARARHFWRMIAPWSPHTWMGHRLPCGEKNSKKQASKKISLLTLSTSRRWPSPCWARQSSWSGRSTSGNLRRWRKTNVSVMVRKWISIPSKMSKRWVASRLLLRVRSIWNHVFANNAKNILLFFH